MDKNSKQSTRVHVDLNQGSFANCLFEATFCLGYAIISSLGQNRTIPVLHLADHHTQQHIALPIPR